LPVIVDNNKATDLSELNESTLYAGIFKEQLFENFDSVVQKFDFFDIAVSYGDSPKIVCNEIKSITIKVINKYRMAANINFKIFAPDGMQVTPESGSLYVNYPGTEGQNINIIDINITAEKLNPGANRLAAQFTIDGRPGVMHAPIVLMN
ncbi:MAG: hypothetical protein KAS17_01855, partial [Victivallaceae bacterium]|nr:hypothetical protein [Victivallaceae bacterium]